jgi:ABC-type transport system involved in multi-copper enzyme maturation permease subunit
VKAQLRAELFKLRSTRTTLGLLAALVGLVVFVVLLHAIGLPVKELSRESNQLIVLGRGEFLAALFAALLGALSITSEIRHGTIRPTVLITPWRGRVVIAKVLASTVVGAALGFVASGLAVGLGVVALRGRDITVHVTGGDYVLLVAGGALAAALWAAIGVGVGAIVRQQVPAVVGLCAWLLFVEGLLVGDVAGVRKIGRFAPGAAGQALSGQFPGVLLSAGVAGLLLAGYAIIASIGGWQAFLRRDVS